MDNTSSSPQLLIPNIPAETCFKGTQAEIFQQYFSTFLASATLNIPGIGDVTPEEIQALQDQVADLQNQVDALELNVRSGSAALVAGDQNVVIAFATAMPDADYDIHVELVDSTGAATTTGTWALVGATKLATGFTIRIYDVAATVTSFNWSVRQIL